MQSYIFIPNIYLRITIHVSLNRLQGTERIGDTALECWKESSKILQSIKYNLSFLIYVGWEVLTCIIFILVIKNSVLVISKNSLRRWLEISDCTTPVKWYNNLFSDYYNLEKKVGSYYWSVSLSKQ